MSLRPTDPFVVKSFLARPKSFKVYEGYCKTEGKQALAVLGAEASQQFYENFELHLTIYTYMNILINIYLFSCIVLNPAYLLF